MKTTPEYGTNLTWLDNAKKLELAKKEYQRRKRNQRARDLYDEFSKLRHAETQMVLRAKAKEAK